MSDEDDKIADRVRRSTGDAHEAMNWLESAKSTVDCYDARRDFDGHDVTVINARICKALKELDEARKFIGMAEVALYELRDYLATRSR